MRVVRLSVRDFRGYREASAELGDELTVVTGPNGAGKTNLVEALYFGCTGRSCRTTNEREVIRFGERLTRVVVDAEGEDGGHRLTVAFAVGEPKRMLLDGTAVQRMLEVTERPLVSVFMPDRLELVKGPPALRRAHLDQFVAALWPARASTRRAYAQTLAQRNALIARIRAGAAGTGSLASWDAQLAAHGLALMADRRAAVEAIAEHFGSLCERLGLTGAPGVEYRPRSRAREPAELSAELAQRRQSDLERGYTGHGPHRDELALLRQGRELRTYGSQGQQRLGLLGLLLAEREALARRRQSPPLMLLDDVMSELDADRRRALITLLRDGTGQAVITATEPEQVPGCAEPGVLRLAVSDGRVLGPAAGPRTHALAG